tara:strand:- start:5162 stop:5956 length:795 start_codon:yes stop_codon:yes gene_type:complete
MSIYVPSRIPGVIWYKVLEYLGINVLARKKCCFLNSKGKVCGAYRENDEIWCKHHGDKFILNEDNKNIYQLLNDMLGSTRIEKNTFSAIKRQFEYKSNLLHRYYVRHMKNIKVDGFDIEMMNGIYKSAPVTYYDEYGLPYDIHIYIKDVNSDEKLCLWKFHPLAYWAVTTCTIMKNIIKHDFTNFNITDDSFAWIYNDARKPSDIQIHGAISSDWGVRSQMTEWQMNISNLTIEGFGSNAMIADHINILWNQDVLTKMIEIEEF